MKALSYAKRLFFVHVSLIMLDFPSNWGHIKGSHLHYV